MIAATQTAQEPPEKIPLINGLRGIAILGVLMTHVYGVLVHPWESAIEVGPIVLFPLTLFTNGFHGMTLFFMLSGFVLALPYFSGHRRMETWKNIKSFYVRRCKRLAPLYIVVSIVGMLLYPPDAFLVTVLLYATCAFIFTEDYFFPRENGALWSLGVEVWLSILLPLFFRLLPFVSLRIMAIVATGVSICLHYALLTHWWTAAVLVGLPVRIASFVLGMLLAERHVAKSKPVHGSFVLGCILLFFTFQVSDLLQSLRLLTHYANVPIWLFLYPSQLTFVSISAFLIIDGLLRAPRSWVHRALEAWWLQMTGLMCYSIYVWHLFLLHRMDPMKDVLHLVFFVIALTVVSWLSYAHIEFRRVRDVRLLFPAKRRNN